MITDDKFKYKDLVKSLKKIGIKKNCSIFLTSNIALMGTPVTKKKNQLKIKSVWLIKSIKKIIGKNGNIFVPTYSYTFSSKKMSIFSPHKTKSKIGYFPNFFMKMKIIRSIDPMVSVSGFGPMAKSILIDASNTSYGKNCVFERMLNIKNLKCLTVGLGINWIPFLHYLDWLNKVPFRYDKYFKGFIKLKNKNKFFVNWHYPVRYLRDKSTISDGYKLGNLAYKNNMFKESDIGRGKIYSIDYKNYFEFCKKKTKINKWLTANGK
jgi:aminoglycoside N3'-acetyltransferase